MKFSRLRLSSISGRRAFTLVEAVVAIGVLGIGVASTVGVLTKMNQFAAQNRNVTGANSIVMNQIDVFLSLGPFNPPYPSGAAAPPPAVPYSAPYSVPRLVQQTNNPNSLASYDMTVGTHAIGYEVKDPNTGVFQSVSDTWPVYQYEDASGIKTIVPGTLSIAVTEISTSSTIKMYQAVVTLNYTYLGRPYSVNMTAIRASDQ